ncbi:MAG: hypothetical protein E6323_04875 [Clostridium perfringens]|nr:hypothetical protein [Clostridium perfringens]
MYKNDIICLKGEKMVVNKSLVNNIDEANLKRFLLEKIENQSEYDGMDLDVMASNIIDNGELSVDELNEYLFNELFYGMHRNINVYKIKSSRKAKYVKDWINGILKDYNIESINYNKLIQTYTTGKQEKISAIKMQYDEKNIVQNIKIIFIREIKLSISGNIVTAYSYIPVEVDFERKIIIIKGRSRNKVVDETDKCKHIMEEIFSKITLGMQISIEPFEERNEVALYNMSKCLLEELLSKVKAFSSIGLISESTEEYMKKILNILPLENIEESKLNPNIMDLQKEFNNIIEELILADYFFGRDAENILNLGISAMLTEIRFSDNKNVIARLSGENRRNSIFNSKSFLGLRNSLESVKAVDALSIAYKNNNRTIHVKYYANNNNYLGILFKDSRAYREEDFNKTWERYLESESIINTKDERLCEICIG